MSGVVLPAADAATPGETGLGLKIRLFGPMEVHVGLEPLPRLRSRKGLWLLALLALHGGREVDRIWLAGMLWPECDEGHGRRSLRQSLHDLRTALGPEAQRLAGDGTRSLRLALPGAWVDALAFDAAVARGDPESLAEAVELHRGPLLEDCPEEWVFQERQRREQAYVAALATLAAAARSGREHALAATYIRQAIGADPYREELQRALMQTLAEGDDPAEALRVYQRFRARLWREMTAEPAPETTSLFQQIREEARARLRVATRDRAVIDPPRPPDHSSPKPRSLPLPLTELIGREAAVQEVIGCVAQSRLVTLTGTGGIGKTRLALQVAEELAPEFEDNVCFVNLAPLAAAERVPDAVQTALGVSVGAARGEPFALLQQYLAPRALLLVLDNCEHLLSACATLAEALLGHCAGLRILATSRQPLGIWGETIWRVPSLPVPGDAGFQAADGAAFPSVRLFLERARAAESAFELTPRNAAAVAEVCRRLDGMPLAIELAAARVGAMPVEQIARRLGDGFGLLAGGAAALPRHQTLAATIEWSWRLLTTPEQILLRRLSVFAGGCTLEMAEVVTGDGVLGASAGPESIAGGDVLDLIVSLVDKSLVVYADRAGGARYQLLETVRQYAGDRLRGSDDWEATQNRHRDVLLEWAEEIKTRLWGPEQGEGFRQLAAEHDNLRAALEWSRRRGDAEKELRLVVALSRFWDTHGHLREGRAHLNAALERMPPDAPVSLQVAALVHAGWMAYTEGDYPAAHRHYERTLILAREERNPSMTADALNYLALVLVEEGDFAAARSLFEESLTLCREFGLRAWSVLSNLGNLALRQADYEAARSYLEQSAAGCEALGIVQEHGLVLHDLSVVALRQGRYDEARARGAASLGLLHACGAVINLPAVLTQMALVARSDAQWERTARLLGAAEALRAAVGGSPAHAVPRAEAAAAAEAALGEYTYAAAFAAGNSLGLEQAIAEASG